MFAYVNPQGSIQQAARQCSAFHGDLHSTSQLTNIRITMQTQTDLPQGIALLQYNQCMYKPDLTCLIELGLPMC